MPLRVPKVTVYELNPELNPCDLWSSVKDTVHADAPTIVFRLKGQCLHRCFSDSFFLCNPCDVFKGNNIYKDTKV